jgi:serine/threonine protein kinase
MNEDQIKKEIKSIKHEISMLKALNHQNIVRYYYTDLSEDGEGVDIILEFVPGGSIR